MKKAPLKILSIDDDLGCQLAASRYLTFIGGHMVEVAENGRQGLEKAAELQPDIILLDMSMPDMNGIEVMQALHAGPRTCRIPVIMITGTDLGDSDLAGIKGMSNFKLLEQKPVQFSYILEKIEEFTGLRTMSGDVQATYVEDSTEPS